MRIEKQATFKELFSRRPRSIAELREVIELITYKDNVHPCLRATEHLYDFKGVEIPLFTSSEVTSFVFFFSYLRKTFSENTIRALFAHYGVASGYIREPENASRSTPFDGLSMLEPDPPPTRGVDPAPDGVGSNEVPFPGGGAFRNQSFVSTRGG